MLSFLPGPVLGALTLSLMFLNTVFWNILFYPFAFCKLIASGSFRRGVDAVLTVLAEAWISSNNGILKLTRKIEWDVSGLEGLSPDKWYLILSNHQSWTDILVLQRVFNRKIPFLKFFLKQELMWVPILGVSWWALDYPFMKRFSKEHLARHPEDRGKDWITTRKKCEHFKEKPTSIINFIEGSRFTPAKRERLKSPYQSLLPPKTGGVGFVMACMGSLFSSILDVTIVYPDGNGTFWEFLCGKIRRVRVQIRELPVPQEFKSGNYVEDEGIRLFFRDWTSDLWKQKDDWITRALKEKNASPESAR